MAKPRPDSIDMKTTLDLCLDEFEKTNVWGYRLWAVLRCFHEIDHWEAIASAARSLWPAARGIPLSRWAIEKRCKDAERDFGTILQKRGMM